MIHLLLSSPHLCLTNIHVLSKLTEVKASTASLFNRSGSAAVFRCLPVAVVLYYCRNYAYHCQYHVDLKL